MRGLLVLPRLLACLVFAWAGLRGHASNLIIPCHKVGPRLRLGYAGWVESFDLLSKGNVFKNYFYIVFCDDHHLLHRSTPSISLVLQRQRRLFSTKTTRAMPFKLPTLPDVPGTDPSRAVLDSFKVAIAKRVADALPPLTVEQVYQGVDYGKKGVDFTIALPRFRLPGKVDVLAKTVIDQVCTKHVAP